MTHPGCPFCQRITLGQHAGRVGGVAWWPADDPVVPGHMIFAPTWHAEHPSAKAVRNTGFSAEHYAADRGETYVLITGSGAALGHSHIHVHYVPTGSGIALAVGDAGAQLAEVSADA